MKNFLDKKKFLITGGTGSFGLQMVRHLLKTKVREIIIFSRDEKKQQELRNLYDTKKISYVIGDVRDYQSILDACKKNNVKELFLASSSEVYQTPLKIPTDEKEMLKIPDIYNPRYSYGGGKIISELLGLHFAKKNLKKFIIFRPHNVYSEDMGNDHVIPEFIEKVRKLKKNKKFLIHGTGNEKRSFIYIDDFISAFDKIFKKGKNREIYNIGTNEIIKMKTLAKKIAKMFNTKIKLNKTKFNSGGTKIRCPNIAKLKKLGFKPKIDLDQGLEKIISKL